MDKVKKEASGERMNKVDKVEKERKEHRVCG